MNPDLILSSDWHIRDSTPICRKDDFLEAQFAKIEFILGLSKKYKCPILNAGDIFHNWKPSPWIISKTIDLLRNHHIMCTPGNHDLPNNNLGMLDKTGLNLLSLVGVLDILSTEIGDFFKLIKGDKSIGIIHKLVTESKGDLLVEKANASDAINVLKKNKCFDLIVSGDNHQSFVVEHEGRLLVNPGSITRQSASLKDAEPSVYLWEAKTNSVERVIIPHKKDSITTEHLNILKSKEDRSDELIDSLISNGSFSLDFKKTLKEELRINRINKSIMNIIWRNYGEEI